MESLFYCNFLPSSTTNIASYVSVTKYIATCWAVTGYSGVLNDNGKDYHINETFFKNHRLFKKELGF